MVCETGAKQLFAGLKAFGKGELLCCGGVVQASLKENGDLYLTTLLYSGGDYIPLSVKDCLHNPPHLSFQSLVTFITVDEANLKIFLNFEGEFGLVLEEEFAELIGEFSLVAEEWRHYIDDNDRKDLIYARV